MKTATRQKRPRQVLTKNQMGWASEQMNAVSAEFVEFCRTGFCSQSDSAALDIGAAFGVASLAALREGAFVTAIDLDEDHLTELRARVMRDPELGEPALAKLTIRVARFPQEVWFHQGTLGAVHASNVFHFLTGNQVQLGMNYIASWLRPGGKLFLHAGTPYQTAFAPFLPEYARRIIAGNKWPGYIEKLSVWSRNKKFSQIPRSIHLLDDIVVRRAAEEAGLTIERLWLYRRADLPVTLHLDGRESVGLIARKDHESQPY